MYAKSLAHSHSSINPVFTITTIITIIVINRIILLFLMTQRFKLLEYATEAEVSPRHL